MDNETYLHMFTHDLLDIFYKDRQNGLGNPRIGTCPFFDPETGKHYHECCEFLFKGWARKTKITEDGYVEGGCPCFLMAPTYVVKKTRAFHKRR